MYMYLFFLKFFPHLGYYRLLSSVPCTMLMSDVCSHGFICHLHPFCCSVAKSCSVLHNPMDCSTPGFSVPHISQSLLKFTQLNQWCHPTISSSVIPFSSCLQSFSASGSFQMSQFIPSGGQSIGDSASASVLSMNIQDWFPLGWTGWVSLLSKDSQESSPTPQCENISSLALSLLYGPTLTSIHDCCKDYSLHYMDISQQRGVFAF